MSDSFDLERRRKILEFRRTHTTAGEIPLGSEPDKEPTEPPVVIKPSGGGRRLRLDVHQAWRKNAACRGMDANAFHPERGQSTSSTHLRAKAVCAGCPVQTECADHAIPDATLLGTWGGLSDRQRRALRKQRRSAA